MSKKDGKLTSDETFEQFKHYINTSLECLSQGCRNVILNRVVDCMEAARRDALAEVDVESIRNEIIDDMIDRANELRFVEPTKEEFIKEQEELSVQQRKEAILKVIKNFQKLFPIRLASLKKRKLKSGYKWYIELVSNNTSFELPKNDIIKCLRQNGLPNANMTSGGRSRIIIAEF